MTSLAIERLCDYGARGPLSLERLSALPDGRRATAAQLLAGTDLEEGCQSSWYRHWKKPFRELRNRSELTSLQ
jgi:hypothetical protein